MGDGKLGIADVRRPLKTAEVAAYLGQTPRNVLRMVQNGQIPAKRLGSQWYYSPRKIAEPYACPVRSVVRTVAFSAIRDRKN